MKIDPWNSCEILTEVMEELMRIGAIAALQSVLALKSTVPGEEEEVVFVSEIQVLLDEDNEKIVHLRKRLYGK